MANDDSNHRARHWLFTLNNYKKAELRKLKTFGDDKCTFMVIGKEVGKTGTPHLQGYLQLAKATAGQTVKNQTTKRLWLGIANGSPKQNLDYCTKEDKEAWRTGKMVDKVGEQRKGASKSGGAATKQLWESVGRDIQAGATEKEMMIKYPSVYYKHHGGIAKGITLMNKIPIRKEKTCVHVYVGQPGCGKTTKAHAIVGENGYFYNSPNKIWWSGYDGRAGVVLDDFHGEYPFGDFKKLTDKYPHKVPVHNGLINFNPEVIVITSNLMPGEWWRQEVLGPLGLSALMRRINVLEIWDAKDGFIPAEGYSLWEDGCVCDPKFQIPETPKDQTTNLLDNSSFLDDLDGSLAQPMKVKSLPLTFPQKRDKPDTPVLQPPKKKSTLKDLPSKSVGPLTRQNNEMYPDPFEVDTQSAEDSMSDDECDSPDSFDSGDDVISISDDE